MRMLEIQSHLRGIMPILSGDFSTPIPIVSIFEAAGTLGLEVTSHGLLVGDVITTNGLVSETTTTVESLTTTFGVQKAKLKSAVRNDLTIPFNETVTLKSTDTDWDGEFELTSVTDRLNFEIIVPDDNEAPTATVFLVESDLARLNNVLTVESVLDVDNISVNSNFLIGSTYNSGEVTPLSDVKIAADISLDSFIDAYTQQALTKNWLVLVAGDTVISRAREIQSDFEQRIENGEEIQIETKEDFVIFAFIPTQDKITGIEAQEKCRNEIRVALLKSLLGFHPEKLYDSEYNALYFTGDLRPTTFNSSFYVHQYNFSVTVKLNPNDSLISRSFALNKIDVKYLKDNDEKASDKIDLTVE